MSKLGPDAKLVAMDDMETPAGHITVEWIIEVLAGWEVDLPPGSGPLFILSPTLYERVMARAEELRKERET